MEQVSLVSRARQAQRRAVDEQTLHTQKCIASELAEAGPNLVVTNPDVLAGCILYLETRVMEYANLGRGEVVILYSDVPAIQYRMQKTQGLRHIYEMDKTTMIKAVGDAFVKEHGWDIKFNYQYMSNSFRISWY